MTHDDAPEDRWPELPTVYYCPVCQPDVDPSREVVVTRWCDLHEPSSAGVEDERMTPPTLTSGLLGGVMEAGGETNRAWCAWIKEGDTR